MHMRALHSGEERGENPCVLPVPESGLYIGRVMHRRLKPFGHRLDYGVFSLLIDIDRVSDVSRKLRLLAHNRWGVLSFHDADHGNCDGQPLRSWVEHCLEERDLDLKGGPIRLFCFPRLWGYAFNPLSIFYCYDPQGRLGALLYEVRNTFGEKHAYVLKVDDAEPSSQVDQETAKVFHVSPFIGMDCRYRFRLTKPGETLKVLIKQSDGEGDPLLIASHVAARRELSDRAITAAVCRFPLMTIKVIAAIHWEALKLWGKGARFHRKPPPPVREVSW